MLPVMLSEVEASKNSGLHVKLNSLRYACPSSLMDSFSCTPQVCNNEFGIKFAVAELFLIFAL